MPRCYWPQLRREGHVLKRGVLREEIEALEYEPKVQAVFLISASVSFFSALSSNRTCAPASVFTVILPELGISREVQAAQHSGLAAAGGADDAQRLALIEGEADALEDVQRIKALFRFSTSSIAMGRLLI